MTGSEQTPRIHVWSCSVVHYWAIGVENKIVTVSLKPCGQIFVIFEKVHVRQFNFNPLRRHYVIIKRNHPPQVDQKLNWYLKMFDINLLNISQMFWISFKLGSVNLFQCGHVMHKLKIIVSFKWQLVKLYLRSGIRFNINIYCVGDKNLFYPRNVY